jgi:hypothetical protein
MMKARSSVGPVSNGLRESLETLAEKLPERMARVKQRAELASRLLESLRGDESCEKRAKEQRTQ